MKTPRETLASSALASGTTPPPSDTPTRSTEGVTPETGDTPAPSAEPVIKPAEPLPTPGSSTASVFGVDPARATVEEVRPSIDSFGQPRSGEIVPTTVPLDILGRPVVADQRRVEFVETPGSAETRVLRSGREVPAHTSQSEDDDERIFTTVTRTLRNSKIYEIDAPIPLTYREFVDKRAAGAIVEVDFRDGVISRE